MKIPTKEECLSILEKEKVPQGIVAHLKSVHDFSMKICDLLEKRNIHVNRKLVGAAALLHDVKKLDGNDHETTGSDFIKSLGYPEVAGIIRKHGLKNLHLEEYRPTTWEEKAVFYADKRIQNNKIVSLDERFEYIKQRYKREIVEPELAFTKKIEKEILGEGKI